MAKQSTWREIFFISSFVVISTLCVAAGCASWFLLISLTTERTFSSLALEHFGYSFIIAAITTIIPVIIFTILTKYTLNKFSIEKRAVLYGFLNSVAALLLAYLFFPRGDDYFALGIDVDSLIAYYLPALVSFFTWVYLAIKYLK